VLPNVNANDGDVREERILVGRGDNLELASGRVNALMIQNQFQTLKRPPVGGICIGMGRTSQPQPEP
jgi:hypothetical protein